jgi:hypothetical protein
MKKGEYLLVTNCSCCGRLDSIVIPSDVEEKHEHIDINETPLDVIMTIPTCDLGTAQCLVKKFTPLCKNKISIRRSRNVYNICKRKNA